MTPDPSRALERLYEDALEIYEVARQEVEIERSDGRTQKYAATRYKQQIDRARAEGTLVPTVAKIILKRTTGFDHLEKAGRHDLMLETLVLDESKPYHVLFQPPTLAKAKQRMDDYFARHPEAKR